MHAYLIDLAKIGAYGKNKAGVMRRFIENGIVAALEGGILDKKDIRDFDEQLDEESDDEE